MENPSPHASATTPATTPESTPNVTSTPQPTASDWQATCAPEAPTALSDGWATLTGSEGHYRFSHPADWEPRGEPITVPITQSVSPETAQDIGFPASAQHTIDLVGAPDGTKGLSAWMIDSRLDTPTNEVFARELTWLANQPQITEVLSTDLEFCVDGSRALGFDSTWSFPGGDRYFLIFTLQRNGRLYQMQLNGESAADGDILREALRTWKWIGPAAGEGAGADFAATDFQIAGLATQLDQSLDAPDPSTFRVTFPGDQRIWLVYKLDEGVSDTVHFRWRHAGSVILQSEYAYVAKNTYAWAWLDPSSGRLEPGAYEVEITLETSGDTITLPFTVQG